eukprot:scaffold1944_cov241-Pinguiococcus_pyrenoidosus.AAC.29
MSLACFTSATGENGPVIPFVARVAKVQQLIHRLRSLPLAPTLPSISFEAIVEDQGLARDGERLRKRPADKRRAEFYRVEHI